MNEEPSMNFVEPKYRFRIAPTIEKDKSTKANIADQQRSYRLRLVSCDDKQLSERKTEKQHAISLRKIVNHSGLKGKITALREDLRRMEAQFQEQSKRKSRISNIKVLKTIHSEMELNHSPQKLILKPAREVQPLSGKIFKKKLNKIHINRIYDYQQQAQERYFPIVQKYAQLRQYYESLPRSPSPNIVRYSTYSQHGELTVVKKYRNKQYLKKIRRAFNAILFIIYLRSFNQRMRAARKDFCDKYLQEKVESTLLDLKRKIIRISSPFFKALESVNEYCGIVKYSDDKNRREKIRNIKRLVSLEVECLQELARQICYVGQFDEILYYLCKHGNYSCLYTFNSPEELSLACVSAMHGYISADRYLEQSAILSLLLFKLLLFNIFLQPESLTLPSLTPIQCKNLKLAGNILYELFIDVQDELLEASSAVYVIGNWGNLKNKFHFKPTQSMALVGANRGGKEVIAGLADHSYIRSVYETKQMHKSKCIVRMFLEKIHQLIAKYHLRVRQEYLS